MAEDLGTEIKIGADASGVEAGVNQAKRSIASLGKSAADAGAQGGKGLEKIGAGSEKAAKDVDRATKNMAAGLQRQIAAFEAGGTATRQYQESLARLRGADVNVLKPLLDQLDAARTKTVALDRAQDGLGKSLGTLGTAANFAKGQMLALASSISFASMAAFVKSINDGVDALNDIKDATGASIENISALENVGKRTGASFETVGSVLVKFNKVLSEATPKSDISIALKAIGLEADALKKIDPAEALRQTAVALAGYADDANKARLIQELFGKSVKEAAPFLTDLAEQTELVGTVTARQAEEAEKLNKQYFELQTKAQDLSRELVAGMVPGLQQITEAMTKGAKEGGALLAVWRGLREFGSIAFGTDKLGSAISDAKAQTAELNRLGGMLNGALLVLERDPGNTMAQRRVDNLRKQIEGVQKTAQVASEQVKELVNGPPPEESAPAKPTVNTGPSAAQRAAGDAAAKKAADERKKELEERSKLLAEQAGLAGSFAQQWEILQKAFKDGALSADQMDAEVAKLLAKQPFMIEGAKKEAKALEDLTKERQAAADALNKEYEGIEKYLDAQAELSTQLISSIEDRIAAMELEDEAATLAAATNISLAEALLRVRAARMQEKLDGPTGSYEGSDDYLRRKAEIEALNREADTLNRVDRNDKARDTTRKAKQDFDRYVEDTSRGLGDAIETAIFDGSKAGGEKMREVLQEALLRKPLRMLIDGVMNQVTGGALQLLGIGGGGAAGGGSGGGLMGLASNASSLYNGYGAVSQLLGGGTAGASTLSLGYANTVGALGGDSLGALISANGGWAGVSATGTGTGAAAGAGGMSGLAAGGVAALVAAVVLNALGAFRTDTKVGGGLRGTLGGADLSPWEEWREGGTLFDGPSFATSNPLEELEKQKQRLKLLQDTGGGASQEAVMLQAAIYTMTENTEGLATATKVQSDAIQAGFKLTRDNTVNMANLLGLAGDSLKGFTRELDVQELNFDGLDAAGIQAKIGEAMRESSNEMAEQILGSWIKVTTDVTTTIQDAYNSSSTDAAFHEVTETISKMVYVASEFARPGEKAIDTLTRLSSNFSAVNNAADAMGFGLTTASLQLADFASDIVDAFGGLEQFAATTGAFRQNFYTDTERREATARQGSRALADIGINIGADTLLSSDRMAVRDAVNSLRGGDAETYAKAMAIANSLSPIWDSFEEAEPAVKDVTDAVDELTRMFQNAVKTLKGEAASMAVELLRAQGDKAGAKALERQQYLDGFVDEAGNRLDETRLQQIAVLYDLNKASRANIDTLIERNGLQSEINSLTDTSVQALARQRDALDESNRALFDSVQAIKLQQTIAQELPGVLDAFRTPQQRTDAGYDRVAQDFRNEGFGNVTGGALAALTKDQIGGIISAVYNLGTTSDSTRLMLLRAAASLSELNDQAVGLAGSNTDAAYAALEREAGLRRKVLDESIADVRAVFDAVSEAARSLYGEVSSTSQMLASQGRSFIENALANAQSTGYLPDSKELQKAISAATSGISKQVYATQFDADRDRLVLAGQLSELGDISGEQLSEQEKQLKALDGLLEAQREQIDAMRGVDTRVLGVDARIALLTQAILAERGIRGATATSPGQSSGGVAYGSNGAYYDASTDIGFQSGTGLPWMGETIRDAAKAMLEAGNAKGIYDLAAKEGFSLGAVDGILHLPSGTAEDWAEAMRLPIFHDGTNFVPKTGFALLQQGEAVIPAAHNPFTGGGAQALGSAEVVNELRALRTEVAALRAAGSRTADATEQYADQFDTVSGGGRAVLTEAQ